MQMGIVCKPCCVLTWKDSVIQINMIYFGLLMMKKVIELFWMQCQSKEPNKGGCGGGGGMQLTLWGLNLYLLASDFYASVTSILDFVFYRGVLAPWHMLGLCLGMRRAQGSVSDLRLQWQHGGRALPNFASTALHHCWNAQESNASWQSIVTFCSMLLVLNKTFVQRIQHGYCFVLDGHDIHINTWKKRELMQPIHLKTVETYSFDWVS